MDQWEASLCNSRTKWGEPDILRHFVGRTELDSCQCMTLRQWRSCRLLSTIWKKLFLKKKKKGPYHPHILILCAYISLWWGIYFSMWTQYIREKMVKLPDQKDLPRGCRHNGKG